MRVLVGDIGGTKTSLALASVNGEGVELDAVRRYPSADAPSFAAILRRYFDEISLDETGITCEAAALAIAGPVHRDRCRTTNLRWEIDARELERTLALGRVRLLNDLEAVAWAVPTLSAAQLVTLRDPTGDDPELGIGNASVVAPGTGLGVAGLYWDGQRHHPFATEAGHGDFAPSDERELGLLRFLAPRLGHVSWERVASGLGIANTHEFLLAWHGADGPMRDAAAIAAAAADQSCPICVETMELFGRSLARAIANVALAHMALGGIYLAGGVVLSNMQLIRRPEFAQAIVKKGVMTPLLAKMPVRVITEPEVALLGAARFVMS